MSTKDKCVDAAIGLCKHGSSWWMPLLLFCVCTVNSLTGGVFMWSIGVFQGTLFPIIIMSRPKSWVIAPIVMCAASMIAAYTYVQLMKTDGADALLEKTGAKGSKWLEKTTELAKDYGVAGLLFLQVIPIPIPTAVLVVAGSIAKIDEWKILGVCFWSRLVQLLFGGWALRFATENMTPEDYIRMNFKGEEPAAKEEKKD
eukprot:TRINITY_DN111034_c0_g1_i1.p1 TRINITY_DN111034_c0_g1~~TRINITY_DN111034_c0_g1_i1.p1  ORF type:complete len:200 (-),score=39.33 TRINITY_DN111034_c0_g1_i1:152-751(-)